MTPALLTAVDSTQHVHLVIGSNPLAGARCSRSLDVGATVKLISLEEPLHYGLQKRVDEGQVDWVKQDFEDSDLTTYGRDEVDHVVDAVFITLGARHPMSMCLVSDYLALHYLNILFRHTHLNALSPSPCPRQRSRCAQPLYLHPPLHILRWSAADRCNNVRQRLQTCRTDSSGSVLISASWSWNCS